MEQVAAAGEQLFWVGDPKKDTENDYEKAFGTPGKPLGSRRYVPQEAQQMVIQQQNGLPFTAWHPWRSATGRSQGVTRTLWRGYPFALREKQLAETREQMSTLKLEAAQK